MGPLITAVFDDTCGNLIRLPPCRTPHNGAGTEQFAGRYSTVRDPNAQVSRRGKYPLLPQDPSAKSLGDGAQAEPTNPAATSSARFAAQD